MQLYAFSMQLYACPKYESCSSMCSEVIQVEVPHGRELQLFACAHIVDDFFHASIVPQVFSFKPAANINGMDAISGRLQQKPGLLFGY